DCASCHSSGYPGAYAGTSEDNCYRCHSSDHAREHPSNPTDCLLCHNNNSWSGATSHQSFQLQGAHVSLDCASCHSSGYPGAYAGTSEDNCYRCHSSDHAREHPSNPTDCLRCHNNNSWEGADDD
ncbi:MAG: hypothetical protein Q7U10_02325, partial [Thermodesulfovibrionia bacterium]|nr:hypothetical protein [Thermodesulfovibrionia bacterium]